MVRWEVDGIITDVPNRYLQLRSAIESRCLIIIICARRVPTPETENYEGTMLRSSRRFLWTSFTFYWLFTYSIQRLSEVSLEPLRMLAVVYADIFQYFLAKWGGPFVAVTR
jgi:hypothetical protein